MISARTHRPGCGAFGACSLNTELWVSGNHVFPEKSVLMESRNETGVVRIDTLKMVASVKTWLFSPGKMSCQIVRGADELRPLGSHNPGRPGGSPLFRGVSHWNRL